MNCFKVSVEPSVDIFSIGYGNKIVRAFNISVLTQSSTYKIGFLAIQYE